VTLEADTCPSIDSSEVFLLALSRICTIYSLNTFDSDDVSGRKQKSIHPGTEASRDVFLVTRDKGVNQD